MTAPVAFLGFLIVAYGLWTLWRALRITLPSDPTRRYDGPLNLGATFQRLDGWGNDPTTVIVTGIELSSSSGARNPPHRLVTVRNEDDGRFEVYWERDFRVRFPFRRLN